jgi:hypothetical protein
MAFYIPYVAGSVSLAYLYSYAYGPSIETMANFEAIEAEASVSVDEDVNAEASVEVDEDVNIEAEAEAEAEAEVEAEAEAEAEAEVEAEAEAEADDKLIIVGVAVATIDMSARVTELETYYSCSVCNMNLPINNFSKNQQKKIKGVWKCKGCASILA